MQWHSSHFIMWIWWSEGSMYMWYQSSDMGASFPDNNKWNSQFSRQWNSNIATTFQIRSSFQMCDSTTTCNKKMHTSKLFEDQWLTLSSTVTEKHSKNKQGNEVEQPLLFGVSQREETKSSYVIESWTKEEQGLGTDSQMSGRVSEEIREKMWYEQPPVKLIVEEGGVKGWFEEGHWFTAN